MNKEFICPYCDGKTTQGAINDLRAFIAKPGRHRIRLGLDDETGYVNLLKLCAELDRLEKASRGKRMVGFIAVAEEDIEKGDLIDVKDNGGAWKLPLPGEHDLPAIEGLSEKVTKLEQQLAEAETEFAKAKTELARAKDEVTTFSRLAREVSDARDRLAGENTALRHNMGVLKTRLSQVIEEF